MRFILLMISLAVLLYGLFRPESPPYLFDHSDKLFHVLGFGAVSLAARIALIRTPGWILWSALLCCAPLSEWLQHSLQPTRQFSWLDISANLTGVVLAALGWWVLTWIYQRWSTRQQR
ncbi:MAG TPA: VanZ family protein [Pseudomonas sp.]|nr:VanZ family protein [Pseudomonas sp.]